MLFALCVLPEHGRGGSHHSRGGGGIGEHAGRCTAGPSCRRGCVQRCRSARRPTRQQLARVESQTSSPKAISALALLATRSSVAARSHARQGRGLALAQRKKKTRRAARTPPIAGSSRDRCPPPAGTRMRLLMTSSPRGGTPQAGRHAAAQLQVSSSCRWYPTLLERQLSTAGS